MTRRIAIIAGAAALLLLAAWFFLLWSPKGNELDKAKARTTAAGQQATQLQVQLDRLKDAERREPELQAAKDRLASAVPDKADLAGLILDINDAAAKADVDFVSVTPSPPSAPAAGAGPSEITFKLDVSGRYTATLDFLQRISKLPRIIVFDTVQVSPKGDQTVGSAGDLSASLGGRTFTLQTPAGATTTTTTPAAGGATTTTAPTTPTTTAPAPGQ